MALADNLIEADATTGVALGIGALLVWPVVSRVGRPIAKEAIKDGIRLYRIGERAVGALNELVAEAQAETMPSSSAGAHGVGPATG